MGTKIRYASRSWFWIFFGIVSIAVVIMSVGSMNQSSKSPTIVTPVSGISASSIEPGTILIVVRDVAGYKILDSDIPIPFKKGDSLEYLGPVEGFQLLAVRKVDDEKYIGFVKPEDVDLAKQ